MGALFLFIALLFLLLLFLEFVLEQRELQRRKRAETQNSLYYPWAYYTRSGTRFGFWRGNLKLQMEPGIVYGNRPNQTSKFFNINSLGLRGRELSPNDTSKRRLLLLGGSTAFGSGLPSDNHTLAFHLESLLGAEVINAAVIGHRSGQELVNLATRLLPLEPDLIFTLSGWNDFSQLWLSEMKHQPVGFNAFELIDAKVEESQTLLSAPLVSRIFSLHQILFPVLERKIQLALNQKEKRSPQLQGTDWKIPLAAQFYAEHVHAMAALASPIKAPFLCVLQCVNPDTEGKDAQLLPHYATFRELVKTALSKRNVPLLDLNEPSFGFSKDLFFDLTHLTGEGHKFMATVLEKNGLTVPKPQ